MTQTSAYGYWVGGLAYAGPTLTFSTDYPVTTSHAAYVLNNAQHLYDESTQYRVNWVSPTISQAIAGTGETQNEFFHLITHIFPLSFCYHGPYPECLVVRIGGRVNTEGANTAQIAAVLCSATQSIGPQDLAVGGYWAKLTGSTSSTTGEWIIEDIMDDYLTNVPGMLYPGRGNSYRDSPRVLEADSRYHSIRVPMARLSVYGYVEDDVSKPINIMGVSVREFRKTVT